MLKKMVAVLVAIILVDLVIGCTLIVLWMSPGNPAPTNLVVEGPYHVPATLQDKMRQHLPEETKKGTRGQAQTCLKAQNDFETAATLTGVPADLLIGIATIESGGCEHTSNGEATGVMQTHKPDPRHIRIAAELVATLGESFDWKHNRMHNVVLGAVVLNDYVKRFGNLSDGLEAYNQGPSKVEPNDDRTPPYVLRVLTAAVMADQELSRTRMAQNERR